MCPCNSLFSFSMGRWVRFGRELELLDSPGIIPMRISDQVAAIKLAICDDIGERSYNVADVAAILILMLARVPSVGNSLLPFQLIGFNEPSRFLGDANK